MFYSVRFAHFGRAEKRGAPKNTTLGLRRNALPKPATTTLIVGDQPIIFSFSDAEHALLLSLGAAMAQIQSFEMSIAVLLGELITKKQKDEKRRIEDEIAVHFEKTLGRLIKHFLSELKNREIADLLEEVRTKRNRIVHNFLRAYGWPMMSPQKYIEAIQEIDDFRRFLGEVEPVVCRHLSDKENMRVRFLTYDPATGELDVKV